MAGNSGRAGVRTRGAEEIAACSLQAIHRKGSSQASPSGSRDETVTAAIATGWGSVEFSNPDIPVAKGLTGISMSLELDGCAVELLIERLPYVPGLSFQLEVVLYYHAVESRGHVGRGLDRSVRIKDWSGPHHVIHLPFARLAIGVGQRRTLLVDAGRLPIHVRLIVVGVEDLHFVACITRAGGGQEQSAIPPRLTRPRDILRNSPFEMQLIVLEHALGLDVSSRFVDSDYSVGDVPFSGCGAVLGRNPLVEILSVEQNDRVRGRRPTGCTRSNNFGLRLPDFRIFGFGLRGGGLLGKNWF